ncbi:MAG: hypothetical protein AAGI70_02865 [Pseudomonadota bacterium]
MRGAPGIAASLAATLLAACGVFGGSDGPKTERPPEVEAERHASKRMVIRYATAEYFVDVRYVDIINESVIAVREAGGKLEGREEMVVPVTVQPPPGEPFASSRFRPVAVAIASHIRETAKICDGGRQMALRLNRDGEARASYRTSRQAWVVFAACPAAGGTG